MTFDPAKPVAYCLYEGKQCEVRNFRRRPDGDGHCGRLNQYPYVCEVKREHGWQWVTFTGAGGNLLDEGSSHILVNAPEPVSVDWGKPVRWVDSKAPLEIVGKCLKKDGTENLIVKWVYDDAEHAMEITPSVDFVAVENVPPPPRVLTVEIAGAICKDGGLSVVFRDNMETGLLRGLFENGNTTGVFDGSDRRLRAAVFYDIGPWQSFTLTLGE